MAREPRNDVKVKQKQLQTPESPADQAPSSQAQEALRHFRQGPAHTVPKARTPGWGCRATSRQNGEPKSLCPAGFSVAELCIQRHFLAYS